MHTAYCRYASPPWASARLAVSKESVFQSELWLPLSEIRPVFYCFFRSCLTFPPIYSSTIFLSASSWFEIVASFPPWLSQYSNPVILLERLLEDYQFRCKFIFWVFMPRRYNGSGSNRYPEQMKQFLLWLTTEKHPGYGIRCLDAACGDGMATYDCAAMLLGCGYQRENFTVEGWSLDPLEAWAAAYRKSYHNPLQEVRFHQISEPVFSAKAETSMVFKQFDLLQPSQTLSDDQFDSIFCNGLLGGPIVHEKQELISIITFLSNRLADGGIVMAADHFHDGWKKKCPHSALIDIFNSSGLHTIPFGEGIAGIKKASPQRGNAFLD